jgi:hypothetical protein
MALEDDYRKLYEWLETAKTVRGETLLKNAERNLDYYLGNQWKYLPTSSLEPVTVNWIGNGIFRKFANLAFKPPKFSVTPVYSGESLVEEILGGELANEVVPDDTELRSVIAAAVEVLFEASGGWMACKAALLDRYIFGVGIVYTTWDDNNGPIAIRVSPFDFLWDPQRAWHDWGRGRFVARTFKMYLDEVKAMPNWSNTRKLQPSVASDWGWNPFSQSRTKPEHGEITLLEAWFKNVQVGRDKGRNVRIIWAVSQPDKPLLVEDWPFELTNENGVLEFPFYLIVGHPVPERFAPLGDVDVTKDQQDELNQLRSYSKFRALLTLKLYTRVGVLSKEALNALQSPVIGEVVQGNADAAANPIQFLPGPPYNIDIMTASQDVVRDIAVLQGVDDAMRGIQSPRRQTATEAQLMAVRSSTLAAYEQTTFETLIEDVAEALWQIAVKFGHVGYEVRPETGGINKVGLEHLIPSKIDVVSGSSRAENKIEQQQNLVQFATFVAQTGLLKTPANPAGMIDARWLIKQFADKFDLRLTDDAFAQPEVQGQVPGAVPSGPSLGNIPPQAEETPPGQPTERQPSLEELLSMVAPVGEQAVPPQEMAEEV